MDLRILDDNEIETLKKLAPQLSHSQLADYLGMSDNCLRSMFAREPELLAVYNKALLDASSRMISQLYARMVSHWILSGLLTSYLQRRTSNAIEERQECQDN